MNAFEAVYGNPNDQQKVQQVIQEVLDKSEVGGTAPGSYTVADLQSGGRSGEARKWALMLSRDPGISVYLLSTALINLDRDEAFGWGSFYQENWQNYSNALNDVIEAWGDPSLIPGSEDNGSGFGPTEPPIELEVPDCPGVVREINAYNIPPSIYPKPNCGGGTPGAGTVNGPTGVCTTDPNVQAYGPGQDAPPADAIFWTFVGGEVMPITQGFGPTGSGIDYSNYDYTLGVSGHPGVDVGMAVGTPLHTAVAGEVIRDGGSGSFWHDYGMENTPYTGELRILLDNGDEVVIGHMSQIDVRVGDMLQAGQKVGLSGYAPGPHLHLEYRKKQDHTNGTHIGLDPRDVFGCAAPGSTEETSDEPLPSQPGPQVEGISTENGQVLQAGITVSPRFGEFQQEYGLDPVTGPSEIDFEEHKEAFATLRDHAVKYAPMHNIAPEIVVMWALTETLPPYDSWTYNHCNDASPPYMAPDAVCPNNNWQIGYGQQYSVYPSLGTAFTAVYGADDPAKVREVLQNVISKSGLSVQAPSVTAASLSTGSDRFWSMILGRDQAISAYLLAQELAGDFQNAQNAGYGNRLWDYACENGWGSAYCSGHEYRERFSNTLNDILLNWGIAGSGISGQVCQVGVPSSTSNCSTIPDSLNGMEVDEFVSKINQNLAAYKQIAQCANVPWEMMAAIHLRETGLDPDYRGNSGGSWQLDPPPAGVDQYDFVEAGCWAAEHLAGKIEEQFGGQGIKALSSTMDPTKQDDEYAIKAAFFGYNGTGGWQGNVDKGCTQALEGNADWNWDCSAYVMNNMDSNHTDMCIVGSIDGGATNTYCDGIDGAWKIYYKLYFSTYDADGQLLVYGGRCSVGNEVIHGMSAPTKAGKSINSQFFEGGHIGIDIGNSEGDPIFAIADGEITSSGWSDMGGYYLILHVEELGTRPEMWVYYGHLDSEDLPHVHGAPVSVLAGQEIGKTGPLEIADPSGVVRTNGITTGPHLHFDLRRTENESSAMEGHVNPCDLTIMKNSYPDLECS